jgi:hypothetical protein
MIKKENLSLHQKTKREKRRVKQKRKVSKNKAETTIQFME